MVHGQNALLTVCARCGSQGTFPETTPTGECSKWFSQRTVLSLLSFQPDGDCELSREYLLQLDVEVLTEFVMCLMDELKRVKSQVHRLEDNRGNIDEQKTLSVQQIADASNQQREQLIEQQSSAFASGKQHAEELADLKRIIDIMRAKAEKHDVLTQENKCLREKIETLRKTNSNSWHYSGDSDCGDSVALNCEVLKAELRLYKNHYIEMKEQRREMMEQLQRAKLSERKVKALKNELYQEQLNRETVEKQLEDALVIILLTII